MSKTILIVDDSPVEIKNLQDILHKKSYVLLTASSGKQGIEMAKSKKPDLIILDIVMNDMDGFETIRQLLKEEETKAIPVVFCSSKNQKADKVWAKTQGGKGYITKPFSEAEVWEELNKIGF